MKMGSRVASFTVCAGLALLGMTSTASAAEVWLEATIAFVYPQADGSLTLAFNEDSPTCLNAASPKYYNVAVGQNGITVDGVRNILSAALWALTNTNRVHVNFDDSTTKCYVNRLIIGYYNPGL
jgi:hypothetical protein